MATVVCLASMQGARFANRATAWVRVQTPLFLGLYLFSYPSYTINLLP